MSYTSMSNIALIQRVSFDLSLKLAIYITFADPFFPVQAMREYKASAKKMHGYCSVFLPRERTVDEAILLKLGKDVPYHKKVSLIQQI